MKTYQIFGRTTYADPLTLIEQISIENDASISQFVREKQSETKWVELVAIPEDKILWARNTEVETNEEAEA